MTKRMVAGSIPTSGTHRKWPHAGYVGPLCLNYFVNLSTVATDFDALERSNWPHKWKPATWRI